MSAKMTKSGVTFSDLKRGDIMCSTTDVGYNNTVLITSKDGFIVCGKSFDAHDPVISDVTWDTMNYHRADLTFYGWYRV